MNMTNDTNCVRGDNRTILHLVEYIKKHGYPVEVYLDVETEDGYLLSVIRMPHGMRNKENSIKPVVLLMHGMQACSADYILAGPERSLAFILSDHGYDVWLYDARGTQSSHKHVKYNADKDEEYWKFSFHEMGLYDLPAVFKKIEEITRNKTLLYIGHSLGTVLPFVLISERPEYNKRFNLIITLASVAFSTNTRSIPYKILDGTREIWMTAMEKTGYLECFPTSLTKFLKSALTIFGRNGNMVHKILTLFINMLHGKSLQHFVSADIPDMLDYYPDTSSAIVLKHVGQCYRSGKFQKFDYGSKRNIKVYGTPIPPLYNLSQTVCPVVIYCSSADLVAQPKDSRILRDHLPNCIALHELEDPTFSHTNFLFGKHAVEKLYMQIIDYLKDYSQVK